MGRAERRSEGFDHRLESREGWARPPHVPRGPEKTLKKFDRSFHLGHPLDEPSQEASMLLKHLATSVKVFLAVRHLIPQSLNQCSILPRSYLHVQPPSRHHPAIPEVGVRSV